MPSTPEERDVKTFRRSRISEIVGLFEACPPPSDVRKQITKADEHAESPSSINVKSIIHKFDPHCLTTANIKWQRAATSVSSGSVNTPRRWVQVEKEVNGKVVAQMWLRRNSASANEETSPAPRRTQGCFTERQNRTEARKISIEDTAHQTDQATFMTRTEGLCEPGASLAPVEGTSSRASHFIAFRIDNAETVQRLVAFQNIICNQYPFLDMCRTNPLKFHLTLLVLSLKGDEVERAIRAMTKGVSAYRNKDGRPVNVEFRTVGAFNARLLFVAPSLPQRLLLDALHAELAKALGEERISIVGAGGEKLDSSTVLTRAFKGRQNSPSRQTRGLLRCTSGLNDVEPESTRGSAPTSNIYLPCPGPGSRGPIFDALSRSPNFHASDRSLVSWDSKSVNCDVTLADLQNCADTITRDSSESARTCLTPTALDLILLKKYDISGYRNTLYVPQVSLFKTGKANRRGKRNDHSVTKMKVFPRLYHNAVQKILSGTLGKPNSDISSRRVVTCSTAPLPPFGAQLCDRIELVEMSLADGDGYYKRLFGINLSDI